MSARIYTTPKLKIETNGRYEMETMHLMDTQADEEKALCGANRPVRQGRHQASAHAKAS